MPCYSHYRKVMFYTLNFIQLKVRISILTLMNFIMQNWSWNRTTHRRFFAPFYCNSYRKKVGTWVVQILSCLQYFHNEQLLCILKLYLLRIFFFRFIAHLDHLFPFSVDVEILQQSVCSVYPLALSEVYLKICSISWSKLARTALEFVSLDL